MKSKNFLFAGDKIAIILQVFHLKASDFAEKTGFFPDKVYDAKRKNKRAFLPDEASRILEAYPEISPRWLLAGCEGDSLFVSEPDSGKNPQAGGVAGDVVSLEKYTDLVRENERLRVELEALREAVHVEVSSGGDSLLTPSRAVNE